MQRLDAADHRRMRWKNGKGETVEIAVYPPLAALDAFEWRVSTAAVVEDGAFSCFAGIDRTLAVLQGGPLVLTVAAGQPVTLTADSVPWCFAGDAPCTAALLGPAVADLNVMTRRGHWRHRLTRLDAEPVRVPAGGVTLLVAAPAPAIVTVDGTDFELGTLDALCGTSAVTVAARAGTAWLVRLERDGSAGG